MKKQKNNGISLIVLVITIIVMIILAGSIILTLSQNGIIGKANEAVDTTNLKQVEQAAMLAWADAYAGGKRTEAELKAAVEEALEDLEGVNIDNYTITVTEAGVTVVENIPLTQLISPTLSLAGDTLTITTSDKNTQSYAVYIDGELKTTISATIVNGEDTSSTVLDLTSLNLAYDTYAITVKAVAAGYAESNESNMIEYVFVLKLPESGVNAETGEITDTWEQIQQAISAGVYSTRYTTGNYKTITITGYGDVAMEIVAFDADTKADGTGTAAISWVSRDIITTHNMNSNNINTNGWAASEMRTWLQGDFYNTLSAEVKNVISPVIKTYLDYNGGGGAHVTKTCIDTVWIPSWREVKGNSDNSVNYETSGPDYSDYFGNGSILYKHDSSGAAAVWWLRSAWYNDSIGFSIVNPIPNNHSLYSFASFSYGVVLGFCT